MSERGIIMYGPPASGKDTISNELVRSDGRIQQFERLKVGRGRSDGYRSITQRELAKLVEAGEIAWMNERYGATYAVDIPELLAVLANHIPVLHLGQPESIEAIRQATPATEWLVVELWCPREIAKGRLIERGSRDLADRLAAWDSTTPLARADLRIDTSKTVPAEVAQLVRERVAVGS